MYLSWFGITAEWFDLYFPWIELETAESLFAGILAVALSYVLAFLTLSLQAGGVRVWNTAVSCVQMLQTIRWIRSHGLSSFGEQVQMYAYLVSGRQFALQKHVSLPLDECLFIGWALQAEIPFIREQTKKTIRDWFSFLGIRMERVADWYTYLLYLEMDRFTHDFRVIQFDRSEDVFHLLNLLAVCDENSRIGTFWYSVYKQLKKEGYPDAAIPKFVQEFGARRLLSFVSLFQVKGKTLEECFDLLVDNKTLYRTHTPEAFVQMYEEWVGCGSPESSLEIFVLRGGKAGFEQRREEAKAHKKEVKEQRRVSYIPKEKHVRKELETDDEPMVEMTPAEQTQLPFHERVPVPDGVDAYFGNAIRIVLVEGFVCPQRSTSYSSGHAISKVNLWNNCEATLKTIDANKLTFDRVLLWLVRHKIVEEKRNGVFSLFPVREQSERFVPLVRAAKELKHVSRKDELHVSTDL